MKIPNKIHKDLQILGLSREESEIYIVTLQSGALLLSDIAKMLGANRTTLYPYIESLIKKNLLKKSSKGRRVLYNASDPKILQEIQRQQEASSRRAIEELEKLKAKNTNMPTVVYHKARSEIQSLLENIIDKAKYLDLMFSLDDMFSKLGDHWTFDYLRKLQKTKIAVRELLEYSASGLNYVEHGQVPALKRQVERKVTAAKLLPEDEKIDTTLFVTDKVVVFVDFERMIATEIQDPKIASTQKRLFENIWNTTKTND